MLIGWLIFRKKSPKSDNSAATQESSLTEPSEPLELQEARDDAQKIISKEMSRRGKLGAAKRHGKKKPEPKPDAAVSGA